MLGHLTAAVAPGGTLLMVGHHPSDLQTTVPRPPMPELFFTGDEIAAGLDPGQWTIIANAVPERTATDPEGNSVTIHDSVQRAVRRLARLGVASEQTAGSYKASARWPGRLVGRADGLFVCVPLRLGARLVLGRADLAGWLAVKSLENVVPPLGGRG